MGKLDDRAAFREWTEYYRSLKKDKASDRLSPVERAKKRERLERDAVAWMGFFFAEFCSAPFTPFHKRAIRRITENTEWYEVLSWSRELAKSTIVFMCVMYLVLAGRKRNVLLISNSHTNAERLLEPYKTAFERNSLLKAYYGDLREIGKWKADEFSLTTGATFRAIGAMESPRGTRKDAVRPDTVLVDDFDDGHRSEQEDDDLARVAEVFEQNVFADELLGLCQEAAVGGGGQVGREVGAVELCDVGDATRHVEHPARHAHEERRGGFVDFQP